LPSPSPFCRPRSRRRPGWTTAFRLGEGEARRSPCASRGASFRFTAGGRSSNPVRFAVGVLPEAAESEPNDAPETAPKGQRSGAAPRPYGRRRAGRRRAPAPAVRSVGPPAVGAPRPGRHRPSTGLASQPDRRV